MALAPGTQVGPYEIVAPVGAGGMGEVYRARDPQLGRDVAIKILGPDLIGSRDAVARFEREARTASALNHPHIVHIYDIGDVETPLGPTRYIAMEYVAGETLRARLRNGALWPELVEHLAQVADALAKAHGAGIVHRDLKPDNIMITFDGYTKVVDFGLAKLIHDSALATAEPSPMAGGPSRTGVIVGTAGYMSPEQAQGLATDARSDLFSFGCVLYEVLAGRAPFKGATALDTMHAIVHDDPPSIDVLSPASPPELRAIAAHCLAKDPARRPQSASDVARDLRAFVRTQGSAATVTVDRAALAARVPMRRVFVWSGVAATALAAILIAQWPRAKPAPLPADTRGPEMRIEKLTNRGDAQNPAISPDGRYLAYSVVDGVRQNIWLRDLVEKTETLLVAGVGGSDNTDFLRLHFGGRGQSVYYSFMTKGRVSHMRLYRVPIIGGEPRLIAEAPSFFELGTVSPDESHLAHVRRAAGISQLVVTDLSAGEEIALGELGSGRVLAWNRKGTQLALTRPVDGSDGLFIVDIDGTHERRVGMVQDLFHAWWNDADTVLLYAASVDVRQFRFFAVDVATGDTKPVGDRSWLQPDNLRWLPAGDRFVVTDIANRVGTTSFSGIWLVSYPAGETVKLTTDSREYWGLGVTADGKQLVTVESGARSDLLVAADAPGGPYKRIATGTDVEFSLCWTADGRIIYSASDAGSYDLYVINADGSNRRQLTFDRPGNETEPAASPDGKYIVFVSDRSGERGLFRINTDGTGLRSLTSPTANHRDAAPQVTPDSRWIYYLHWDNGPTLWKLPIDGGTPTLIKGERTAATGDFEESAYAGSVSPDGRALAFLHFSFDPVAQRFTPFDVAVGSPDGKTIARRFPFRDYTGIGDHDRLQWSADGRALYYLQILNGASNLWKQPVDGRAGEQVTEFEEGLVDFDWSFDGKALAVSRRNSTRDIVLISNFVR